MTVNQRNEHYLSNIFCRIYLESLADLVGTNGLNTCLNLAGLGTWVKTLPPANTEKDVEFTKYAQLNQALEEVYGVKGGQSLARQAGWTFHEHYLATLPSFQKDLSELENKSVVNEKVHIVFNALCETLTQVSDIACESELSNDDPRLIITSCPNCWGRKAKAPVCFSILGILERALRQIAELKEAVIVEEKCISTGDDACEFLINMGLNS